MSAVLDADTISDSWSPPVARLDPATVAPGGSARIVVTFDVPSGCHVQSHAPAQPFLIPTTLTVDDARGLDHVELGPAEYPTGEPHSVEWSDIVLDVFRGSVEISVPVRAAPYAAPGTRRLTVRLRYQGCTESMCLWPVEHTADVDVIVADP